MPKYRESKPKENQLQNIQQHLIQKILSQQQTVQNKVIEEFGTCKYGVYCAHLRTKGQCLFLHTRNHYLFLNLVPPNSCIQQVEEHDDKLTKKERKQKKILQKTINQQINVAQLKHKEAELNRQKEQELHKQIMSQIDEKQKKVIQIVSSSDVSQLFTKLNKMKNQIPDISQIKRRSMMQLRKKNDTLYKQVVDKIIKAAKKNASMSLSELYADINHDSLPAVRQYFQDYFKQQSGIPYQALQNEVEPKQNLHITKILTNVLFMKPEEYRSDIYLLHTSPVDTHQIRSNIELFNLMVPFSIYKKQQYNKFYYINCQEDLSLSKISQILLQDHLITFHAKCKNPPLYPFGFLETNIQKFKLWASKIRAKFNQHEINHKIVFVLNKVSALLSCDLQQFELEKQRERQQTLKALTETFPSVALIFLSQQKDLQTQKNSIVGFLGRSPESITEIQIIKLK